MSISRSLRSCLLTGAFLLAARPALAQQPIADEAPRLPAPTLSVETGRFHVVMPKTASTLFREQRALHVSYSHPLRPGFALGLAYDSWSLDLDEGAYRRATGWSVQEPSGADVRALTLRPTFVGEEIGGVLQARVYVGVGVFRYERDRIAFTSSSGLGEEPATTDHTIGGSLGLGATVRLFRGLGIVADGEYDYGRPAGPFPDDLQIVTGRIGLVYRPGSR